VPTAEPAEVDLNGRPVALRALDLAPFFSPHAITIVGASDEPGRPNTGVTEHVRRWAGINGATVYPVNPKRTEVGGLRSYPTLADVPEDIDLAVIVVADAVGAVQAAIDKKARFAVVFSAGFAEVGEEGRALQDRLQGLVAASELHLLGPNTNLNVFDVIRRDLPGKRIAIITQSGHQGRPLFQAQDIGVALEGWAPTGNEADLEFADFLRFFADQPDVGAIAAYAEGFKDGRTFCLAADHAARQGVPLVIVKVGRTEKGRETAVSHTAHLTGRDGVINGVFRQYGVTRVEGLDELLDTSVMLARSAPPRSLRRGQAPRARQAGICIYSISGGTGAHACDMAEGLGLVVPTLGEDTQRQLHEWIPAYLRVSNPVDNGGHPVGDWRGRRILDTLIADPAVDVLVCPITGAFAPLSDKLAADLVAVAEETDKPICVIWGSPVGDEEAYRDTLLGSSRLAVFRTFGNCLRAIKAWYDYHAFRSAYRSPWDRPGVPRRPSPAAAPARAVLAAAAARPGPARSEHEAKAILTAYGIPVSRDVLVTSAAEAARAVGAAGGPVVMKACSAAIAHKTERGLVRVGVASGAEARRVYGELVEGAGDDALDGVLVCEQVSGGVEAVVGLVDDELFGKAVMVGLGGVLVDVFGDVAFRVPPFDRAEARRMVGGLRGSALLRGVRGRPPADLDAVVSVIMAVQRLALDLDSEVAELDINPLLCRPDGCVALDALIVRRG
jgi:acyl-CoA synthetase (NDP forming)